MLILEKMRDRVKRDAAESDIAGYPTKLLYLELTLKLTVCALVAAIQRDKEGHQYRQLFDLVRADGLGDWVRAADEILSGPTSAYLYAGARSEQRELTHNVGKDSWQHECCRLMNRALTEIGESPEELPDKIQGRRWLSLAAQFRNSSIRGHGVDTQAQMLAVGKLVQRSADAFSKNFGAFKHQWAYLHQNLSGKYLVRPITSSVEAFSHLKGKGEDHYADGVYIALDDGTIASVELVHSDVDVTDFFLPNGAFNERRFQTVSYITGSKREADAAPYMRPAGPLPQSETHGQPIIDLRGSTFTNAPEPLGDYIARPNYERELTDILVREAHPVVSVWGRGGIGKTSITLNVLERLTHSKRFFATVWFSARDIDLLETGPKLVKPAILTQYDAAQELVRLLGLESGSVKRERALELFAKELAKGTNGPMLFVFDNFETFLNPRELYAFIDTHVRQPNKILITSRDRLSFKGDYPIEILGMEDVECEALIDATSRRLDIFDRMTPAYRTDVIRESSGHPYIIKFLLGELARKGAGAKVERILAAGDAMLSALFERTYAALSPGARRVFLTLSNWKSRVFRIALEAVLLRSANEYIDIASIDELISSSFIEATEAENVRDSILSVPLVAQVFGRQKLSVSPLKAAVEADTKLLVQFGAMQATDKPSVFDSRLRRFIGSGVDNNAITQIVRFIASRYARAWYYLSELYDEQADVNEANACVSRFLEQAESAEEKIMGWRYYIRLAQKRKERIDEIHGLSELAQLSDVPFVEVSSAANRLNTLFRENPNVMATDERRAIVSKVADIMQARILEGDATDRSRLSWLYRHLGEHSAAVEVARDGLRIEPTNLYCKRIVDAAS